MPLVPDDDLRERKRLAKVHNKRVEMTAGAVNAAAIALAGGAIVVPVVASRNLGALTDLSTWIWLLLATALHWGARQLLGRLKSED